MLTNVAATSSSAAPDSTLIATLLDDALTLMECDQDSARRRIEQASRLARKVEPPHLTRGGLAPWQLRRVEAYVDSHLEGALRVQSAAAEARLSASHFSRTFKATVGVAFSAYVRKRRVEMAKHLLMTTDTPICRIALACGLADQSHLTRLFSRWVGLPPSAWRRTMQDCPAEAA
jgi:AraC-like DNA-binding protein